MQQNCQDAAFCGSPANEYAYILALDGCGSKYRDDSGIYTSHNESGAHLLGSYASTFLHKELAAKPADIDTLVKKLYAAGITYLDGLTTLHPFETIAEQQRFIATHLLTTLVGFVVTPQTAVFFPRTCPWLILMTVNRQFAFRLIPLRPPTHSPLTHWPAPLPGKPLSPKMPILA